MAELTDLTPQTASACCSSSAQETCCAPSEKAACCDGGGSCGCAAGQSGDALRETVRERYAAAATGSREGAVITDEQAERFGAGLTEIEITETHRVHEHAGSAIIRAHKPH